MKQNAPIAEPIPLAAPDGTVYAYACPRCRQVRHGGSVLHRADDETVRGLTDGSRLQAGSCCLCRRCGRELDAPVFADCPVCAPIEKAEQEERSRAWAERALRRSTAWEDRIAAAKDRDAACRLDDKMRDLSEEYWAAGWLNGLEFSLWRMVTEKTGDGFGVGNVPVRDVAELQRLHEACGGWWHWDDDLCGEMFVPTEEWLRMYAGRQEEER